MATIQPRTPVRALNSSLINRAAPGLPPSTQNYEPQIKSVLRYRLSQVFLQSALVAWAVNTVWVVWQSGGPSKLSWSGVLVTPVKPLTLLGTFSLWVAAAMPAIVLRKVFLTAQRTPSTSPSNSLSLSLSKRSTKPAFITYTVSAVTLAVVHAILSYTIESNEPHLSIFVKSKKHPHYLNGRFLFLLLSQLAVASSFLFRNMLRDRFAFRWVAMSSNPPSVVLEIVVAFFVAFISISSALPLACTVFALIRMVCLPVIYKLPLVPSLLRPFTAHFLRGPYTLALPFRHLGLLSRAWLLGFTTFFLWEAAESLFEGTISEPVRVVVQSNPNPTASQTLLVSGISSSDLVMKYFAYAELSGITTDKSAGALAQRQALFGDQKSAYNLWASFVRETLLLLGKDYQHLLRRGAPAAPASLSSTAAPMSGKKLVEGAEEKLHATPAHFLRRSILKSDAVVSPKEPLLGSLGSEGPVAPAVDKGAAPLPELFRSVRPESVLKTEKPQVGKPEPAGTKPPGVVGRAWLVLARQARDSFKQYAPMRVQEEAQRFGRWWMEERISRRVDACLPMRELDVVVIETLTRLVCASLTEDTFGVVQRDIPKILEALLSFLTAIEDYQTEIIKKYTPPPVQLQPGEDEPQPLSPKELEEREALRNEVEKATELLAYVGDGLKDGVARIVRTFGDKLTVFKFPPRTAQKLQGFMDFCP